MSSTVLYAAAAELATLTNTFEVDGTATDPTTVSLAVTSPDGTTTTYTYALAEITKVSTGVYRKDISCAEAGTWVAVWTGTGAASDVVPVTWQAFDPAAKLYAPPALLKSRLGIDDTADDLEIQLACEAVSRDIDEWCKRHFYRTTATRVFASADAYRCPVDDLVSVTTLKTDAAGDGTFETTWSVSDYQLQPVDATTSAVPRPYRVLWALGRTFPYGCSVMSRHERVEVTGVWGWPSIPPGVRSAALILAAEQLKLKDAPFGVAGFGEFGAVRIRDNPKATRLLQPYRHMPVMVA